jgi:hypothetical protein
MGMSQEQFELMRRKRPRGWLGGDRYKCILCGDEFVSTRDEAHAISECREHFGEVGVRDMEAVCPECWRESMRLMYG